MAITLDVNGISILPFFTKSDFLYTTGTPSTGSTTQHQNLSRGFLLRWRNKDMELEGNGAGVIRTWMVD